jgi:hypothetical protein
MRFLPSKLLLPQPFDSLLAEDKVATSFLGSNSDYWAVETNENGIIAFSPSHSRKHLPHGNELMLKKNLKKNNIQSKNKSN